MKKLYVIFVLASLVCNAQIEQIINSKIHETGSDTSSLTEEFDNMLARTQNQEDKNALKLAIAKVLGRQAFKYPQETLSRTLAALELEQLNSMQKLRFLLRVADIKHHMQEDDVLDKTYTAQAYIDALVYGEEVLANSSIETDYKPYYSTSLTGIPADLPKDQMHVTVPFPAEEIANREILRAKREMKEFAFVFDSAKSDVISLIHSLEIPTAELTLYLNSKDTTPEIRSKVLGNINKMSKGG